MEDCNCRDLTNQDVIEMMDDQVRPYEEFQSADGTIIRFFDHSQPEWRFKWHWDDEDRTVEVINNAGWKFQFDNELPFAMENGMQIEIERGRYHRIIPGWRPQKLKIIKHSV